MVKLIPAGYVGSVDDAVAVVRFLLSEEARYVNGANIQLSGAWGVWVDHAIGCKILSDENGDHEGSRTRPGAYRAGDEASDGA
jgi:hypothetical protein